MSLLVLLIGRALPSFLGFLQLPYFESRKFLHGFVHYHLQQWSMQSDNCLLPTFYYQSVLYIHIKITNHIKIPNPFSKTGLGIYLYLLLFIRSASSTKYSIESGFATDPRFTTFSTEWPSRILRIGTSSFLPLKVFGICST